MKRKMRVFTRLMMVLTMLVLLPCLAVKAQAADPSLTLTRPVLDYLTDDGKQFVSINTNGRKDMKYMHLMIGTEEGSGSAGAIWNAGEQRVWNVPGYSRDGAYMRSWSFRVWLSGAYADGSEFTTAAQTVTVKNLPVDIPSYSTISTIHMTYNGKTQIPREISPASWDYGTCFFVKKYVSESGTTLQTECTDFTVQEPGDYELYLVRRYNEGVTIGNVGSYSAYGSDGRTFISKYPHLSAKVAKAKFDVTVKFHEENYVYGNRLRSGGKLVPGFLEVTSVKDVFGNEMDPSRYQVTYDNRGMLTDYVEASNSYSFYAEVTPLGADAAHYQATEKNAYSGARWPTPATVTASVTLSSTGRSYDGTTTRVTQIASDTSAVYTRTTESGTETVDVPASEYQLKLRREGTNETADSVTNAGTYEVVLAAKNARKFRFANGTDTLVLGTYTIAPLQATVTVEPRTGLVYDTQPQQLYTVTVKDSAGTPLPESAYTVSYSSAGTVTDAGTYTNTVTVSSPNYILNGGTTTAAFPNLSVTVAKKLLANLKVNDATVSYDGQPHSVLGTPFTVTDAAGATVSPVKRYFLMEGIPEMVYPVTADGHTYYLDFWLKDESHTDVGAYPYSFTLQEVLYENQSNFSGAVWPTTAEILKNYRVNVDTSTRFTITKSTPTIAFRDSYETQYPYGSAIPFPTAEDMELTCVDYAQLHFGWVDDHGNAVEAPTQAGRHILKAWTEDCANTYAAASTTEVTVTRSTSAVEFSEQYRPVYTYGDTVILPTSKTLKVTGAYFADVVFTWTDSRGEAVDSPRDVGTYTLTAAIADSANCTGSADSATVIIEKRTVTVSGITAKDKVYDASTAAEPDFSSVTVAGAQYGERLSVTASAAFSDKNVGADKTVTLTELTLVSDSADVANYSLDVSGSQQTAAADITARELEVLLDVSAVTKVYDADTSVSAENAALVEIRLQGIADASDDVRIGSYSYAYTDKNAGTGKTLKAELSLEGADGGNYSLPASVTGTGAAITPRPATLTVLPQTLLYGQPLSSTPADVQADGLAAAETVTAVTLTTEHKDVTDAGAVTLAALEISGSSDENYDLTVVEGLLTVKPAPVTVAGIAGVDKVYDATLALELNCEGATVSGLAYGEDLKVSATGTLADKTVGTGKPVAISGITLLDGKTGKASNYVLAETGNQTETTAAVTARELTVAVTVADKQYDGTVEAQITEALLQGVAEADSVALTVGTARFSTPACGEAVEVVLEGFAISGPDAGNYALTAPEKTAAGIYNTYDASEYTLTPAGWTNGTVTLTAGEGWLLSQDDTAEGIWQDRITFAEETGKEGGSYTFFLRDQKSLAISLPETVSYYIDKTNPTGTIALTETKGWRKLVKTVSFGLFFKDAQTVVIEGADALSGVESIEYFASDKALTQAQVEAITAWKEYPEGGVDVALKDGKQFVYVARITDFAGNYIYLSTDGAVYDTTAPQIGGVEDGGVYYTTRTVTVTEPNLKSLTLNGEAVTAPVTLKGNEKAAYEIVAEDLAGNKTTVKVTVLPISALDDAIEKLTEDTVTSDDADHVDRVLDICEELLKDPATTEEEKKLLEEEQAEAEELRDAIEEATADISTDPIEKVADVTKDTVVPEDREDLEKAKKDLEEAVKDHPDNYTEEERKAIEEDIQRIEDALETLDTVEEVEDLIGKLPDEVETDLTEEEEEPILEAGERYEELTDHEKELLDEDTREKIESLLETLTDYKITEGAGKRWTKGSGKNVKFVANGPDRKFDSLLVDGKEVDSKYFTHDDGAKGGTVVILKASFLQTLKYGKHTLRIVYTDGQTNEVTFRIMRHSGIPFTGDSFNPAVAGVLCLASGAALMVLLLKKKKK